jgi:NADH-quinone oxidoreductase subunit G/NADP-reducing hydrogenase subunit HndD
MKLIINGTEIQATRGETVLKAAKRAGIDIPHLCSLDWAPSPAASCRLCVVEVEGNPRLLTSCTLEVTEGMQVHTHTPRVLKARRAIMELLIASHPQDCLSCVRSGDCELATLAGDLGVRQARYVGAVKQHPVDISSPALWRDPNKCVLCGRCVTVCHDVQGVGAIDFVGRGFKTKVAPGFAIGLNVSNCVYCGQCARVCPTGAIVERDQVDEVVTALADPDTVVVAQVAPAVPATLLEGHSKTEGVRVMLERLAAALKRVGFDAVFDTSFAADVTIMEEGSELLDRIQNGGVLPMFTSCSPAWVNYVETHRPDLIPHLSTCKSPQQMAGALIREIYPRHAGVEGKRLVVVSVMPCTAKKFEAQDQTGVDLVLTTRELEHLWGRFGLDFAQSHEQAPLDAPFAEATGAGRLFAGSGGVMEAAVRTAHLLVAGQELEGGPKVSEARGKEDVRRFTVTAGDVQLNLAVVSGLGRLAESIDRLLDPAEGVHFVEVMSCPGGCVGGGGQPYDTDAEAVKERLERLYEVDRRSRHRRSHENADVQALYEELLGRPLGEVSHRLLHRTYTDRSPNAAAV